MSDLSRLLGDVYGATAPTEDADATDPTTPLGVPAAADDPPAPPVDAVDAATPGPVAPGWADEAVLDEAFAEWVPGPPSDADAEERDILADVEPAEAVAEPIDIDAWLGPEGAEAEAEVPAPDELEATAAYEAFVPEAGPEPEEHALTEADTAWTRDSDDLLPRGRRARRLSLSLRR